MRAPRRGGRATTLVLSPDLPHRTGVFLLAAVVLCSLMIGVPTAAAGGSSASPHARVRLGGPPTRPASSRVLGTLPADTHLAVTVTLKPRDPEALASYATAVSTPGSSLYHNYLTVAEFRQQFGPMNAEIDAVEGSLRAHGLHPGRVSANGLAIPVSAPAGTIARAFSLSFQRVQLPNGRVAFANTAAAAFDASIAATVQGVVGLDSLNRAHPLGIQAERAGARSAHSVSRVVTGGPQPCAAATSDATTHGAYTADELASAYEFSSLYGAGDKGAGQTVALYELEPDSTSDIAAYQSCYGTSTSVSDVQVDGGAGTGSGSGEAALDIEGVIGLAPSASIRVYQGPNSSSGAYDTYNSIVTDDVAKVISTSWGACEAQVGSSAAAAENTLFQEAATQGQSIFAAAGDDGSQDCTTSGGKPLAGLAVDDPASQPYVTGVGGTTLSAIGPPPTQSVWNDGSSGGAGGGGISKLWKMPSYQSGAPSSLNVINSNSSGTPCSAASGSYCREVPDVSADADEHTGYVVYYSGSWTAFGGTSAAAPLWGALTAVTNASNGCNGTPIGFANPVLYGAAASGYSSDFSDITSGNNNLSGSGPYPGGAAYDMASGLGTPIGSALPAALCAAATGGTGANSVSVTNPGSRTTTVGVAASLQINASDSDGSQSLSYSATGLPGGLSINSATGVISGTPTTTGGNSVTVTATDSTGASGSAMFTWTITARSTSSSVSCSPASVNTGSSSTCTATVTDTSAGTKSTPSGTVGFAAAPSGEGSFTGGGGCTLAGTGTAGVATCQTTYTPSTAGSQTITASYQGDSIHSTSTSGGFALTATAPSSSGSGGGGTPSPPVPQDQTAPLITGTAKVGDLLACSPGGWTGSPTGYAYQWNRDGSAVVGATSQSYRVQTADRGSTLTCTVTAGNVWGMGAPATSAGVLVAPPTKAGCPAATGRLSGSTLGLARLGMTRRKVRAVYSRSTLRSRPYQDVFCLTPSGVRIGYPAPGLLGSLKARQRKLVRGRVVWMTTTNRRYAIKRITSGTHLAVVARAFPDGLMLNVGRNRWYYVRGRHVTLLLKIRGPVVQEVGVASNLLTGIAKLRLMLASALV